MASTFVVMEIPDRPERSRVVAEAESLDELFVQVGAMRVAARVSQAKPVPRGSESPTVLSMRRRVNEIAIAEGLLPPDPIPVPEVIDAMPLFSD